MPSELFDHSAEAAVLGSILQDAEQLDAARSLSPEAFHLPAHAQVWAALLDVVKAGQPVDHLTLAERLKACGQLEAVGGPAFLMRLDQAVPFSGNVPAYVGILKDRALRRAIVSRARETARAAENLQAEATAVALESSGAFASLGAAGVGQLHTLQDALGDLLDELDAVAKGLKRPSILTGIDVWDELIGGLQRGKVTVIGAQPSVGKSALMGTMIENIAVEGTKAGVFSLEDPRVWLPKRLVSRRSGVPVKRLSTERLPEFAMQRVGEAAEGVFRWAASVLIDDRSGLTATQVSATARQMVVQHGAEAIFVDHLGELGLEDDWGRHDLAVHAAFRQLRDVAKDLDVAVVVLAHFHRPKASSDKEPRNVRPTSAMWANSGGIEKMARVAVGLWEDEELPGGIVATVLKQTEGEKDLDFWMPLHKSSGLVESRGGRKRPGSRGYTEDARGAA